MTPNVRAAYLVDPVDGFAFTQGMLGYPSAVMLLKGRDKKLGITGVWQALAALAGPLLGCKTLVPAGWGAGCMGVEAIH